MLFNSVAFQAISLAVATSGAGALLIGFKAAAFFDFNTGFGGGSITNLRSSTIGVALAFGIVDVTEIVVEEPEVEVCNLAGNGLPGAFFIADFLASLGFTMLGERFATFLTGAFFVAFLTADLAGFFTEDFLLFFADFLNNLRIATIPPGGERLWLVATNYQPPPLCVMRVQKKVSIPR
jgi:hypothetical protein